jgi:hypothetical protein
MPFHKNNGNYSGHDIPKGGVPISNSDVLRYPNHRNVDKNRK